MDPNSNTNQLFGQIDRLDMAWLAGLLEGEGSFVLNRRSNGKCDVRIQIAMSDEDVISRVALLLTKGKYRIWDRKGYKMQFLLRVTGTRAAGWMMTLYGLMGLRRRERIRELLAYWKVQPVANKLRDRCGNGHPYDIDRMTYGRKKRRHRGCSICQKQNRRNRYTASRLLNSGSG